MMLNPPSYLPPKTVGQNKPNIIDSYRVNGNNVCYTSKQD
jgi:hypothetical protein